MLVLFKKNGELYVKCKLNLRDSINCNDIVFDKCVNKIELVDPEVVSELLTVNANIKLFVAGKFLKVNLGAYYDMISKKNYRIEEIKEHEKKVIKEVVSQPESEVISEPEVEEEVVVEQEQPKKDNSKHNKSNNEDDNKKKRHKQNNNNNQGGDK